MASNAYPLNLDFTEFSLSIEAYFNLVYGRLKRIPKFLPFQHVPTKGSNFKLGGLIGLYVCGDKQLATSPVCCVCLT